MSHPTAGRRLIGMTRAPLALVLLAACASPAVCGGCGGDPTDPADVLPASFRIEAEIVSVEPGPEVPSDATDGCTPTLADADPFGPDWRIQFDDIFNADEPTFKEWIASRNGDSADVCHRGGTADCCDPLVADEGGGWLLRCKGSQTNPFGLGVFEFHFDTDGSGASVYTRTSSVNGKLMCIARTSWSAIIAPES